MTVLMRTITALSLSLFLVVTPAFASPANADSSSALSESGRLIVRFEPGTTGGDMARAHSRAGARVVDMVPEIGAYVVDGDSPRWFRSVLYRLDGSVQSVEADAIATTADLPNDPYYDDLRQWGLFQIGAEDAWDVTHSRPDISIAVLDTGIDSTPPDLADKIVAAVDFTGSGSPEPVSNSHGTHVAGIAAASTDNALGVAGLAWDASLMNAKVMEDDGTGYYSWIASGVIWATDNGADVINMSLSGSSSSSTLADAVNYAWDHGVIVVAAAGNDGVSSPQYPAAYENCISVAASTSTDELASWSNHGASWVDVSAPSWAYSTKLYASYTTMQGTSMACPVVAGLAALVFDVASDTNGNGRINDEVRSTIESTCVATGADVQYGRIDAAAAVGTSAPPTTGQVSGTVVDAGTSAPLEGVSVTDGVRSTTTDAQGSYVLAGLPAGTYTIEAALASYVTSSQSVSVTAGETTAADFSLEPESAPNQPPVLDPIDDKSVDEDQLLTFAVSASDPDSDPLSYGAAGLSNGATFVDGVFSWTPTDGQDGAFSWTPTDGQDDAYEVTFTVSDGDLSDSETITITVNAITRQGAISGIVTDALTDNPVQGAVVSTVELEAVTDVDGCYLIEVVPEGPCIVQVSAVGYYTAEQDTTVAENQTVALDFNLEAVPPPNQPPALDPIGDKTVDEDQLLTFALSASDPDNDPLSYNAVGLPDGAALADGVFSWTPVDGQDGSYEVTFSVSDGALEDSETISITVNAITRYGAISGTVTDALSGSPIASAVINVEELETTTDADGYYEMVDVEEGSRLVCAISDGYYTNETDVAVGPGETTILDVALEPLPNAPPVLDPIGDKTVDEDGLLTFTLSASDPNGDALTYQASTLPDGAIFSGRIFEWLPTDGQDGVYEVTFTVTDGELADSETISITVLNTVMSGTVSVTVRDAISGSPVSSGSVCVGPYLPSGGQDGLYTFEYVTAGEYVASVEAQGYEGQSTTCLVNACQVLELEFELIPVVPHQAGLLPPLSESTGQ